MKRKKAPLLRITSLLLLTLVLFTLCPAPTWAKDPAEETRASHILLYCVNTESILFEKNADTPIAVGYAAQLMTALLTIEHYSDLDQSLTLDEDLIPTWYFPKDFRSHLDYGFLKGAVVPVRDLLAVMVIENATSAATLLGALMAGSPEAFAERMNARAKELGMTATTFRNPSGIDAEGGVTTPHDLLLLASHLQKEAKFTSLASQKSYKLLNNYRDPKLTHIYTRNYLIGDWYTSEHLYKNANGMKAWHTDASGHSVITTSVENNGYSYIAIVLGGAEDAFGNTQVYKVVKELLGWGSVSFSNMTLLSKAEPITSIPVLDGDRVTSVAVFPREDITAYLLNTVTKDDLTFSYTLTEESLTAPFGKDTVVGKIKVFFGEEEVGSCPLITVTDVAKGSSAKFRDGMASFFKNPITIVALIFLSLVILRKILIYRHKLKKKQSSQQH